MSAMEYPAGFVSTLRRSGLAPGMDAHSAAVGQLAVPEQPPLGQASDGGPIGSGDLPRNSAEAQQMTGAVDKTSDPPHGVEVKEQVHASRQQSLQEGTQTGAVGQQEQLQQESFQLSGSDDPRRVVEVQHALFRAVVQDNSALVSKLIAQQPELLT
jgi:hypothetical protein